MAVAPMKKPVGDRLPDLYDTMSVAEFARRHGLRHQQVMRLLRAGELPFEEIMGEIRIPHTALPKSPSD